MKLFFSLRSRALARGSARLSRKIDDVARAVLTTMSDTPSEQLQKYLRDEEAGLSSLEAKFLWQMEQAKNPTPTWDERKQAWVAEQACYK